MVLLATFTTGLVLQDDLQEQPYVLTKAAHFGQDDNVQFWLKQSFYPLF